MRILYIQKGHNYHIFSINKVNCSIQECDIYKLFVFCFHILYKHNIYLVNFSAFYIHNILM